MVRSCEEVAHENGKALLVAQGFHDPVREQRAIENLLIPSVLRPCDSRPSPYLIACLPAICRIFPYMVIINRILPGFEDRCVNINNFQACT